MKPTPISALIPRVQANPLSESEIRQAENKEYMDSVGAVVSVLKRRLWREWETQEKQIRVQAGKYVKGVRMTGYHLTVDQIKTMAEQQFATSTRLWYVRNTIARLCAAGNGIELRQKAGDVIKSEAKGKKE